MLSLTSADPTHKMSIKTLVGGSTPWRAINRMRYQRMQIAPFGALFPSLVITSPTNGQNGQSLSFNVVTSKGAVQLIGSNPAQLDYVQQSTQIQIRRKADQIFLYQSPITNGLFVTIPNNILNGATDYEVRARHRTSLNLWLPWSSWSSFKTTMTKNFTISTTNVLNGDTVQIKIGESATSAGADFHVSGSLGTFPPSAYNSGNMQITDSLGTALPFMITSVTGTTPSRTATVVIQVNAQVISDGKMIVREQA